MAYIGKHSSLLWYGNNNCHKKLIVQVPGAFVPDKFHVALIYGHFSIKPYSNIIYFPEKNLAGANTLAYIAMTSVLKKNFYNIDDMCQCYKTFFLQPSKKGQIS